MPPNCYRTRPAAASSPHPLIIITSCMHPCADHYHHQQFASWTEGAGVRQCRGIEERVEGWGNLPRMWTEKKSTVQWTSNHRLLYVVRLKYNFNFPLQVFRVFCFFIVVVGWYSWSDPFRPGYTFIYTYMAGDAIWLLSVYSPFSPLSLSTWPI